MSTTIEQHNMSVHYTESNHILSITETDGTVVNVTHSPEPNITVTPSSVISDYTVDGLINSITSSISASGEFIGTSLKLRSYHGGGNRDGVYWMSGSDKRHGIYDKKATTNNLVISSSKGIDFYPATDVKFYANNSGGTYSWLKLRNVSRGGNTYRDEYLWISGSGEGYDGNVIRATGSIGVQGNISASGEITAKQFNVTYVTSSVLYESGSTKFGNSSDDLHQFTGSVKSEGGFTGSLLGDASLVKAAGNSENEYQYMAFLDNNTTNPQQVLFSNELLYNPISQTLLGTKVISQTNMTQYHVSALVNPFGKTDPIGPSFEGAKYTFWSQNHFGGVTPQGYGDPSILMYGQWAMTGIPIVATCQVQSAVMMVQPEADGIYEIHGYAYTGFEKGELQSQNQLTESPLILSGSAAYSGVATDSYTGYKAPYRMNAYLTDTVMNEGDFLVVFGRSNNGKPFYVDVAINAKNV
tara:strand:+ start:973 stop:2379 length:1407 start_codon:yes stop_codon:yes gene_type:complete